MQSVPIIRVLTNIFVVYWQLNVSQCSIQEIKNQKFHSRSSICSFLGLIAHIQLFIELNKLVLYFIIFLDAVYMLINYFKPLATVTDGQLPHVT